MANIIGLRPAQLITKQRSQTNRNEKCYVWTALATTHRGYKDPVANCWEPVHSVVFACYAYIHYRLSNEFLEIQKSNKSTPVAFFMTKIFTPKERDSQEIQCYQKSVIRDKFNTKHVKKQ